VRGVSRRESPISYFFLSVEVAQLYPYHAAACTGASLLFLTFFFRRGGAALPLPCSGVYRRESPISYFFFRRGGTALPLPCSGVYRRESPISYFFFSSRWHSFTPTMQRALGVQARALGVRARALGVDAADADDNTRLALAIERRAIASAWRTGQTRQLELVRFLVRDSIEEEMGRVRGYKEGEM
jgi:hypothetical protein